MTDYTRLTAALAEIKLKVDALLAKPDPVPDEQHAVDDLAVQAESIAAQLPTP